MKSEIDCFTYRGVAVQIKPAEHRGKLVYWIVVRGHEVTFVAQLDTARRIAVNFVDVVLEESYLKTRKAFYPHQNANRLLNH